MHGVAIQLAGKAGKHKVAGGREYPDAGQGGQRVGQRAAVGAQARSLFVQHGLVAQHRHQRGLRQHVQVVGRAQLVQFGDPVRMAGQVAETQAGQADLGHRAHDDHVGGVQHLRHPGAVGERLVGLVQHHQPGGGGDDGLHVFVRPQAAGGVVGHGQEHHLGLMFADGGQHGRQIQGQILGQRHADKAGVVKARRHVEINERRPRRQHHVARVATGLDDDVDEFIRAVAKQHVGRVGHAEPGLHRLLQGGQVGGGIAVQRRVAHGAGDVVAHCLGQFIRAFHRVQLDAAIRVGDRVRG
ncbi:hypothetical protein D3C72_505770 [compost metagenome]